MSDLKSLLSPEVLLHICRELSVSMQSLVATIELLDEGGTVPFIARYRKEATGNLDEVQIRAIEEKLAYHRELADRKQTILASIAEQGKLTDELKQRIESSFEKSEVEDLYLPYRPKRRTKATIAREKGLEPLALYIWNQEPASPGLLELAGSLLNPTGGGAATIDEALEGARHIVAEMISEHADCRKALRQSLMEEGVVVSRRIDDVEGEAPKDPQQKFHMYYDYKEPASKIPSHRMLAIRRGENEGVLYFQIELDPARPLYLLREKLVAGKPAGDWTPQFELAIEDAYKRLLHSSIQAEVRMELKLRSEAEAIKVFRENLENLLLAPPAGQLAVLAIDPGIRTGCKIAVVDETGKFLDHTVIYPHEPKLDLIGSARTLKTLVAKYNVRAIAIGNGTAGRETEALVRQFLKDEKLDDVFSISVNESGASVYSASDIARQEFPDLDLTVRGAISIARRLQDPLAELVKIDPKSIGVGQYQHDVDQHQLHQSLETVIESCVNRVGVDLNTASWALLRYVAGINERTAIKIVDFRNAHGKFKARQQLLEVPGVGPKTFEQSAGFLRIRGGINPLDSTAVHPESYKIVEQMAQSLQVTIPDLIKDPALVDKADKKGLAAGTFTLHDILEELKKPGRDPRDKFVAPSFRDDVKEISDLRPGMALEGVVTNVTKFGAFVDIGVHQDGLVHVSELSVRYVQDPNEAVKVGQIVKVQVLSADPKTKRISLSIKALQAPVTSQGKAGKPPRPPQQSMAKQQTMEDKLQALSNRWKTR